MNMTTVKFKSDDLYYNVEEQGLKNHTEREIDDKDERFIILKHWMKNSDYGHIEIQSVERPNNSFIRQIKHITTWKNIMIITWRV